MKKKKNGRPNKFRCPECGAKGRLLRYRYGTKMILCTRCESEGSMTSTRWRVGKKAESAA